MAALRSVPRRLAHARARVRPVRRAADADADVRWLTERGLFDNKGTPMQAHPKYWDTVASLVAVLDVEPVEAERILAAFTQFRTNAAGRPYALRDSWRDPLANDQPVGAAKAVVRAIGQPAATRAMRNHATLLARRADDIADTTDVLQRAGVTKSTLQRRPALLGYRADTLGRRRRPTPAMFQAVLVATHSKNLAPLTESHRPFPLLPVLNAPLLSYPLQRLEAAGFPEALVVVAGDDAAEAVAAWVSEKYAGGLRVEVVRVPEDYGSADCLRHLLRNSRISHERLTPDAKLR